MDSTKKRESSTEMINKQQFSPVSKILSPKSTQGRNLTGSARHVRDLAADVHANIQQWNAAHLQGVTLLKSITQEKRDAMYSQNLQELCDKLENVCDTLDSVVKNLAQIAHQMKIVASLEKNTDKLFTTWPAMKFGQVVDLIHNAYSHEAVVKRKIFEDAAHHHAESWQMLFLAAWVHQPLLPDNIVTMLESLLVETGHR